MRVNAKSIWLELIVEQKIYKIVTPGTFLNSEQPIFEIDTLAIPRVKGRR